MSGVEQPVEAAILAAIASDADVSASLGDPLRIADLASPQPAYPYLEVVRRQSEPSNSAGCEGWVVTTDLAVMARQEGGGLARSVMAEVRSTLRDADLPMDSWHCVVLTRVFTDTLRQTIERWCSILRLGTIVEAAD